MTFKKIVSLSILGLLCGIWYMTSTTIDTPEKTTFVPPYSLLLDHSNKPTPALLAVLKLFTIEHNDSLSTLVQETQKQWLRAPGKERWQVDEIEIQLKDEFNNNIDKLGLIKKIVPIKKNFSYAIILGATLSRTRSRLAYLIDLWKQGVRFDSIIFLGSERSLDKEIEKEDFLLDLNNKDISCNLAWKLNGSLPTTEMEMMKLVYDQADLPEEFKNIPVEFINTPNFTKPDGTIRRASTSDTIIEWLKTNPTPGSCLFVSSQPYVVYQDSVIRTYMPPSFGVIETVGQQARSNVRNTEILDTLARSLYQENIRRNNK